MEKELPPWLNEEFLVTVLQGGVDKEPRVTVNNFTAKMAVAPGNNYLSHIFRVKAEYEIEQSQKTKTIMVKAPITKGFVSEMSNRMDVFGKELKAYNELLVKVNEKLNIVISPTCYYCPVKALVLQDMKEEGYIMCDKHEQLDYEHCNLALTTLAKFHAATVSCYHEDPDFIKTLGKEQMFVEGDPDYEAQFKPWLQACLKTVAGIAAGMEGCQSAVEYVTTKADGIGDSGARMCRPKASGLNVLNHGDIWVNNMLFKHDNLGNVEDVKFIDYQILRYGSPVLDLIYFLWTSAREDVRENKLQDLYLTYLETLNETLEELGCEERMTEEELQQDLKTYSDWVLIAVCSTLPMMQAETDNVLDMEEINKEDLDMSENSQPAEMFMKIFQGKRYQALLQSIMKQLYKFVSS